VAEITPSQGKVFHLTKMAVSCGEDVEARLRWAGTPVGIRYFIMGKLPFTDWFPWKWNPCEGDGVKKFDVQVRYPAGGVSAWVEAEICGEEV